MKWFDNTSLTLVIIGAVNWLLIGIFRFDFVAFLFWKSDMAFQNYLYTGRSLRAVSDQFVWKNRFHVRLIIHTKGAIISGCPLHINSNSYLVSDQ